MSYTGTTKARRKHGQRQLSKDRCEICGRGDVRIQIHHIIPRCDPRSSQDNWNLAAICGSCHDHVHGGDVTIVGVYMSTSGRILKFYKGDKPPEGFLEREYWHIKPEDNPMVIRGKKSK